MNSTLLIMPLTVSEFKWFFSSTTSEKPSKKLVKFSIKLLLISTFIYCYKVCFSDGYFVTF